MSEIHDFDNTVVAILSQESEAEGALSELTAAGFEVEVLRGQEGKEHLDPAGETGAMATVKRLLNAFGDQYRVIDRLYEELDEGNLVISVDATSDEAGEAVGILQDHDGEFIWRLGTWTHTRIGE
ncbi:MAG: hypothetical protein WAL25_02395 [Acidimicrobiia bacterium]